MTGPPPTAAGEGGADDDGEGSPITAATAAAQASTAHGLAVQAASKAQHIAGRRDGDGAAAGPARPRRDAFSVRDPLSPSPTASRDEDDSASHTTHSAEGDGGGGAAAGAGNVRPIRERLRKPSSQQRQQHRGGDGTEPPPQQRERLPELPEASGYDSSGGYSSSDEHPQGFLPDLLRDAEASPPAHPQPLHVALYAGCDGRAEPVPACGPSLQTGRISERPLFYPTATLPLLT